MSWLVFRVFIVLCVPSGQSTVLFAFQFRRDGGLQPQIERAEFTSTANPADHLVRTKLPCLERNSYAGRNETAAIEVRLCVVSGNAIVSTN